MACSRSLVNVNSQGITGGSRKICRSSRLHGQVTAPSEAPRLFWSSNRSVAVKAQPLNDPLEAGVELPLRMNNVPHPREMRQFFYQDVCTPVKTAISAGECKMSVRCTIPETNPEMDVYRVGTILELVRDLATSLAEDGKKVKVCVQQALGEGVFQGMPLSLSGVRRIMEAMDWGGVVDFVSFGEVGADQVDEHDNYILIAPQNVVGNTIMTNLTEMADEAVSQKKPIILVNPLLRDIPSAGGIMGIRGRKERREIADSFKVVYHFRLLYRMGYIFPIKGALRYVHGGQWELYKRVNLGKRKEDYRLVAVYEEQPAGGEITTCFEKYKADPFKY